VFDQFFYFSTATELEGGGLGLQNVQGSIRTNSLGDAFVPWLWIVSPNNSIQLIPVTPNTSGKPYYNCEVLLIGSRRLLSIEAVNYPKENVLSNQEVAPAQPIPDGIVWLEPHITSQKTDGWSWAGWMINFEYIPGDPGFRGANACEPPSHGPNGERYVLRVSDTEVLIVIITEDGTVTVLVYRLGDDGCWYFGVTPDTYEPPPQPGATVPEMLPLVLAEYLIQSANGNFLDAPFFPIF